MRKLISLFLILSLNAYGQSEPITRLKLEGSGTYVPGSSIQVPNNSATKISGSTSRLETGNTNLLSNPSFEATVPSTGWTLTNATSAANTSFKLEGAQSLQVTPTVAGGGIKQSVTLNASNLLGSQGVIEVPVRTSGTDVKVCFLANSVRTYCKDVPAFDASSAFKTIVTPMTFDGTSNGIEVYSTGTSVFIVDEIKIGRGLPLQNVSGYRSYGTLEYPVAANCSWLNGSTSFIGFPADTDCATPITTGYIKAPSTKIPAFVLPSGSPAGTYFVVASGYFRKGGSTAEDMAFQLHDGTNALFGKGASYAGATVASTLSLLNAQVTYSSALTSDKTIELQAQVSNAGTANANISAQNVPSGIPLQFQIYYLPPESKIYSQASQDVAYQPCTFSTLAWQGLGTVTNNLLCARKGQNLLMKGRVTLGTVAASQAQIPLPTNFGTITTASNIPSTSYASGFVLREASSANTIYSLIQLPSVSYLAMAGQLGNTTINPNSPLNGSAMFSSSDILSIPETAIPIQGWQDYGVIVGSFAGIEKCANDYECTDTFSAQISSTGVVSNENIDWLSGTTCPTSGQGRLCTYQTFLKDGISGLSSPMNCVAIQGYDPTTANIGEQGLISSTTTGVNISNTVSGIGNNVSGFTIKCQKGTNDYKPKTAKVASSIGVPTVPGLTTQAIDTFSVSYGTGNATTVCSASPCSYLDQIGNAVSSITRSTTGKYLLNTTKTYSRLKCSLSAIDGIHSIVPAARMACELCNTLDVWTAVVGSAYYDTAGTLYCQGSY